MLKLLTKPAIFLWKLDIEEYDIIDSLNTPAESVGGDCAWRSGPVGRFFSIMLVMVLSFFVYKLHSDAYLPLPLFSINDNFLFVLLKA